MLLRIKAHVILRPSVADKAAWPRLCDVVGPDGCACALSCASRERHANTAHCTEASEPREAAVLSGFGASNQRRTLQQAYHRLNGHIRAGRASLRSGLLKPCCAIVPHNAKDCASSANTKQCGGNMHTFFICELWWGRDAEPCLPLAKGIDSPTTGSTRHGHRRTSPKDWTPAVTHQI